MSKFNLANLKSIGSDYYGQPLTDGLIHKILRNVHCELQKEISSGNLPNNFFTHIIPSISFADNGKMTIHLHPCDDTGDKILLDVYSQSTPDENIVFKTHHSSEIVH